MSEWLKLLLALGAAAVGLTVAAMLLTWLMNEPRRLGRVFRRELGGRADAALIAHGTGRGVALSLAARRFVTVWDRGHWRMVYPLEDLIGAELELDGHVAARALRDETRRRLERQTGAEEDVRLRFLFDDPAHPDFELALWPNPGVRGGFARPREAIAEANRWLARIEAVQRRAGAPAAVAKLSRTHRPLSAELSELAPSAEDEDAYAD
ncbi:MAG TPA: hypothetical protein VG248_00380 [Caulobacteraceae bacterium]|jgi:hypothetical protein|nr:hypothetical protein [Caulobacteraceae bacterium]